MRSWVVVLVGLSSVASAQPPAEYRELFIRASEESAAGHFEDARDLFQQAHRIFPNSRTHRALGIVLFEVGDYVAATQHLLAALNDERRPLSASLRESAQAVLDQANRFVGRYRVMGTRGFVLHVDQRRVMTPRVVLGLGEHLIQVSAPGHITESRTIRVEGGENETILFTLRPAPPAADEAQAPASEPTPTEPRPPDYSAPTPRSQRAGVGLIGSGIGLAVIGVLNHAAYVDASRAHRSSVRQFGCLPLENGRVPDEETNSECRRMVRRANRTYPWIYVGYVAGGAAILTGVLLRALTKRAPPVSATSCSPFGLGVECATRF